LYEAHGWFGLAETPHEADAGALPAKVDQIRDAVRQLVSPISRTVELQILNGQHWLVITVFANRRREEADRIAGLIKLVAELLPGSWGLLYERDDEMPIPPGPNAFRVTVLARGVITQRLDPFLSPSIPVIED
jgi:Immunity protein 7